MKKISYPVLALLIALPVMFRGLFFEYDFSVYAAIALAVVAVFALFAKGIKFNILTDTSLAVFVALYGILCLFGVNKGLAVSEFIKYLAVFVIYFLVKGITTAESGKVAVIYAVVLAAGVSSIISLLTAAGLVNYTGAYSAAEIEKWLNGTVQYHNAFGALTVMALFAACALNRSESKFIKYSSAIFGYFIAFGMIMSYSRGAWVTAPIAFVVYMVFADKETRLSFFEVALSGIIATVAVLGKVTENVGFANLALGKGNEALVAEYGVKVLGWLFAGFAIFAAVYFIISLVFKALKNLKHFNVVTISIVSAGVAVLGLIVLLPEAFSGVLPAQLVERLAGISFGTETVQERFVFYKDALKIAKQSPILGSGGGAWQDLYGAQQSYYYSSSQAHSYIMQVLVETGIVGLLAWVFTIVMFFITATKLLIKKVADRRILAGAVSAVTVLVAHSFIDFDLSLTAFSIILWALFAVIFSYETAKEYKVNKYIGVAVCACLIVVFICNGVGLKAYEKGGEYFVNGQSKLAYQEFSKASSFRPFDAQALSYKAYALSLDMQERSDREVVVADIEKAEVLAPKSIIVNQNALSVYSGLGAYDVAMGYARKLVELQPMNIDNYYSYLLSGYQVVEFYYRGDNPALAKKIADEAITIEEYVKNINETRLEKIELTDDMKEMLMFMKVVSYNVK